MALDCPASSIRVKLYLRRVETRVLLQSSLYNLYISSHIIRITSQYLYKLLRRKISGRVHSLSSCRIRTEKNTSPLYPGLSVTALYEAGDGNLNGDLQSSLMNWRSCSFLFLELSVKQEMDGTILELVDWHVEMRPRWSILTSVCMGNSEDSEGYIYNNVL